MTEILLTCVHCDHEMRVDKAFAGKLGWCMRCGERIRIPDVEETIEASAVQSTSFALGRSAA